MAHFKWGGNFGEIITKGARDAAWYSRTYNDGVVYLLTQLKGLDIQDAKDVIEGKKKFVTASAYEVDMVDDNWNPPNIAEMDKEIMQFVGENLLFTLYQIMPSYVAQGEAIPTRIAHVQELIKNYILDIRKYSVTRAYYAMQGYRFMFQYSRKIVELRDLEYEEFLDAIHNVQVPADVTSDKQDEPEEDIRDAIKNVTLELDPEIDSTSGWLSPEGEYFACGMYNHNLHADAICWEYYPNDDIEIVYGVIQTDEHLLEKGWIKISNKRWFANAYKLSKLQIEFMYDWVIKHETDSKILWDGWRLTIEDIIKNELKRFSI